MHIHTCQDILNIVLLTSVEDTLMGAAVGAEGWDQHGGSLIAHPPLPPFPKPHTCFVGHVVPGVGTLLLPFLVRHIHTEPVLREGEYSCVCMTCHRGISNGGNKYPRSGAGRLAVQGERHNKVTVSQVVPTDVNLSCRVFRQQSTDASGWGWGYFRQEGRGKGDEVLTWTHARTHACTHTPQIH